MQYWQTKAIGVAVNEPLATTVARSGNSRGIGRERAASCRRWSGQSKTGFAEIVNDVSQRFSLLDCLLVIHDGLRFRLGHLHFVANLLNEYSSAHALHLR